MGAAIFSSVYLVLNVRPLSAENRSPAEAVQRGRASIGVDMLGSIVKSRVLAVAVIAMAFVVFESQAAHAFGWGANFRYAYHGGTLTEVDDLDDIWVDANIFAIGLTLDTAVAMDRVFNYRLELDYEYAKATVEPEAGGTFDYTLQGIGINNVFGFGFVRNRAVRVYAGPVVRFGAHKITEGRYDGFEIDFGAGAEIGANFHLGDNVSISTTFGYQALAAYVQTDEFDRPYDGGETEYGRLGYNHRVTVGVSVLFRSVGDTFDGY